MFKLRIISLVLLSFLAVSSFAKIMGSVQSDEIYADQPFQYTITTDHPIQPDLSPLEKHFHIIGQSAGQQISYINGRQSRLYQYVYTLSLNTNNLNLSKDRTGIMIPSISAGNENTRAIQLTVLKPSNTTKTDHNIEAKIEVSATPEKPYVQQEIMLNIDIYLDEHTANLIQAMKLSPVSIDNTLVKEFPQPQIYRKNIDGKPMVIVVKKLAIFPQNSGEVHVPPITFAASILDEERNRNPHSLLASSFFQQTKTFRVTSNPLKIDILPRPLEYNGTWVPTPKLTISDTFMPEKSQYEVGEAINRTIEVRAENLLAEQLPEMTLPEIEDMNIYSSKPEFDNSEVSDNIVSQRKQIFTYLATKPGNYVIPEIKVTWYDTQNKKTQTATLEAKKITIIPSTSNTTNQNEDINNTLPISKTNTTSSSALKHTEFMIDHIGLIITVLLIIICFVALYIYLRLKGTKVYYSNDTQNKKLSIRSSLCLLEKAFKSNDPSKSKQAYLSFINTLNNKQLNKQEFIQNLSQNTKNKLSQLDKIVYGYSDELEVDLKELFNLIKRDIEHILKQKKIHAKKEKSDLPKFYQD